MDSKEAFVFVANKLEEYEKIMYRIVGGSLSFLEYVPETDMVYFEGPSLESYEWSIYISVPREILERGEDATRIWCKENEKI